MLGLAQEEFDVLLTVDRGIPHQQGLSRFDLALVILEAKGNKIADLSPLMDTAAETLRCARPGEVARVTE